MKFGQIIARVVAEIDGEKYEPGAIKASEAERITAWTGYGLREWEAKLVGEADPLAARALLALTEFRKGGHVSFKDVDVEDIDSIVAGFVDEQGRKIEAQVDADGEAVMDEHGRPVLLLDGEPVDPLLVAP